MRKYSVNTILQHLFTVVFVEPESTGHADWADTSKMPHQSPTIQRQVLMSMYWTGLQRITIICQASFTASARGKSSHWTWKSLFERLFSISNPKHLNRDCLAVKFGSYSWLSLAVVLFSSRLDWLLWQLSKSVTMKTTMNMILKGNLALLFLSTFCKVDGQK